MIQDIVSKNGEIIPASKAAIPIDDISYQYGYGVYESLKVRNRVLYFPEDHVARLRASAKHISLPGTINSKKILTHILSLCNQIKVDSFNVKVLLIGRGSVSDLYIIALNPVFPKSSLYTQGVSVITAHGQRPYPNAKTLSMLPSYIAYAKAKSAGAYDALLVDPDGNIVEGTRTNFYWTDGDTIYTAPDEYVLAGVTRKKLLDICKKNKISVEFKTLHQDELSKDYSYFLSSTSSKIVPITKINNTAYKINPLVKKIISLFDEFLTAYAKKQNPV